MLSKILDISTKICKVCFENIDFAFNSAICNKCFNALECIYEQFDINGIDVECIYNYDEEFSKLLYRFKGCYDYELKDIFLCRQKCYLKIKYSDFFMVPVPSWKQEDEIRGFNHVIEIFKLLNLPIINCLEKKENFKQSNLPKVEREKIKNKLKVINGHVIKNKKILIIDDVLTTGSTIKAVINLLENYSPKIIKVLILARKCRKKAK